MMGDTEFLLQITVCFLLSACIGVERQYRRRSVGLRTIILVSLGAFLFVRFSFAFPKADLTRVAAQVVAGIGFLGAGVIIKDGKAVKGLTTAATLWCAAAIGILCSAGLLFEAAVGTLFILFTNIILRTVNSRINNLSGNINYNLYHFNIVCEEKEEKQIIKLIKDAVKKNNTEVNGIEITDAGDNKIKLDISIFATSKEDNISKEIMGALMNRNDIYQASFSREDKRFDDDEEL